MQPEMVAFFYFINSNLICHNIYNMILTMEIVIYNNKINIDEFMNENTLENIG